MAGDVKAAGDMVAQYTDIASRMRRPQEAGAAAGRNAQTSEKPTTNQSASDAVDLTDTSNAVRRAEQALASQPVVDSAKVNRLRDAIADGSYEIDPQRIADKLVDMESSLSGKRT